LRANRADTYKSDTSAASAQVVSLTADRDKRIGTAANPEMSDQVSNVVDDALHHCAHLLGAYGLQHVVKNVGVDLERHNPVSINRLSMALHERIWMHRVITIS
jgi:hypothetical protein